jgi:hypothetical protein
LAAGTQSTGEREVAILADEEHTPAESSNQGTGTLSPIDQVLAEALPHFSTQPTNDFREQPPVISDSDSEVMVPMDTATGSTETQADTLHRVEARTEQVTMRMRPARADAVMFDGKEVTEFLDEYNRQADNALLNDRQKVSILPDYCDNIRRSFIKKMRAYGKYDWQQLQDDMKEHWRDHDTAQRRGTRAYLEAYIQQSSQAFPGISDYYTNFLVTSDAGVASGQVHETERGFLFFKGLPRMDKELVLFSMPEHRPNGIDVSTYKMDEIYKFVRTAYRQREGIKQTSYSQAEEDMRRAQLAIQDSRRVTTDDIQAAVKELQRRRDDNVQRTAPPGVDQEVQELIDAMKGAKISTQEVETLRDHPSVGPLLREGKNFVYFLSQVTNSSDGRRTSEGRTMTNFQPRGVLSRNDGSFITDQPRNVDPDKGAVRQGRGEYCATCNMCGDPGHFERDCEHYKHLLKMGWISFSFDRDARRTTWFYGPNHKRLGEIEGPPPPTYRLHWLKGKIREFFEVTDDVLDAPASQCKPEKFDGYDSRPGVHRNSYRPTTPTNQAQGNTVTIKRAGSDGPAAEVDLAEFQTTRMLSEEDALDEVLGLDHVDLRDIVLGNWGQANTIGAAQAAVRTSNKDKQPTDKTLEQVRQGQVQKKRGRPRKEYDATRLQREVSDDHTIGNEQEDEAPTSDYPIDEDSQTLPYPSQAHDDPFSVVRPPDGYRYPSADIDSSRPKTKKKVQFSGLSEEELQLLLNGHPNRIPTAMLQQEVRGLTIADLLGENAVRRHLESLLRDREGESNRYAEANVALVGRAGNDASGDHDQSASVGFAKRDLMTPDWPAHPTHREHAICTKKKDQCEGQKFEGLQNEANMALQVNLVGENRHRLPGTWDTWNSNLDRVSHHDQYEQQKVTRVAFVQSELPTCWASVGSSSIRCLIDTGAQINLLRKSAALAMRIPYEELDYEEGKKKEGVVSANGSVDPFVGTAWHVPVKIGQVVTKTHFRIIENLTRSAILGSPWCASARMSMQYNVFGRVVCRILDSNGSRNATFIASDPAPYHPKHVARIDDDEDSEN